MTLGNMRELGVHRLIASCLNDAYRHQALINVSSYFADTENPFIPVARDLRQVVMGKRADVQPNWKEWPTGESLTRKRWR